MKILLIEDEPELRRSVKRFLSLEGYLVESAADYPSAAEKADLYQYDCILLDITIPGGSGLNIIKDLKRAGANTGIIIISAKDSLHDKVAGLELGADDYLPKPFHLSELNARIKALIRRKNFDGQQEVACNEIRVDLADHSVSVNSERIFLTAKEYDLLLYFLSNQNRVVTKLSIAEHLSGDAIDQSGNHDFIYTHIKNLRKKLLDKGCSDYIQTMYGIGYNFKTN